ncbi:MAG: restriction endonuclease subunit S [bacterium]
MILSDLKYIKKSVHENMLKRSQFNEGDLLVKITGVGRMAISCVVPYGFSGNINQHITRIKIKNDKKDFEVSRTIAAFLNSDIGEILASRRSTGGTRPALDYLALKSIPIVYKPEIVEIMDKAYSEKKEKEAKAQELLDSIDDYVLGELGIKMPEVENKMCFAVDSSEIESRIDPYYYKIYFVELEKSLTKGKFKLMELSSVCNLLNGFAFRSNDYVEFSETLNVRMSNIRPNNSFDPDYNPRYLPNEYSEIYKEFLLNDGDIIIAMTDMASDPKILGVPTIIKNSNNRKLLLNQRVGKLFDINEKVINLNYLKIILSSQLIKGYFNRIAARGVQLNISREQILSAKIPLPPLEIQNKIAEEVKSRMDEAKQLQKEAIENLEQAKQEVERMIFGE